MSCFLAVSTIHVMTLLGVVRDAGEAQPGVYSQYTHTQLEVFGIDRLVALRVATAGGAVCLRVHFLHETAMHDLPLAGTASAHEAVAMHTSFEIAAPTGAERESAVQASVTVGALVAESVDSTFGAELGCNG